MVKLQYDGYGDYENGFPISSPGYPHKFDESFQEWIPRSSDRINRSGRLKLFFDHASHIFDEEIRKQFCMSYRSLAVRCGHDDIVQWIDVALAPVKTGRALEECNRTFIDSLLEDGSIDKLQLLLEEAKAIVISTANSALESKLLQRLDHELHVLDKHWQTQKKIGFSTAHRLKSARTGDLYQELRHMVHVADCENEWQIAKHMLLRFDRTCCSAWHGLAKILLLLGFWTQSGYKRTQAE
jgi:hypothetical protein